MRKLPVTSVIDHSFRSTWNNIAFAIHISWPWMLAFMPFNIAGNIYAFLNAPSSPEDFKPMVEVVNAGLGILTMLIFASIAVSWHRYILLDEVPQGLQRLRLDWTVWRYFGNSLLIILIMFVAALPVGFVVALALAALGPLSAVIAIPVVIAAMLAAISYSYRFGVKLPAVALERNDYRFKDALRDTEGNFWSFVGLGLLVFLIFAAVGIAVGAPVFFLASFANVGLMAVLIALQLVVNWIIAIWGVTMLTSLYGYFAENRNF